MSAYTVAQSSAYYANSSAPGRGAGGSYLNTPATNSSSPAMSAQRYAGVAGDYPQSQHPQQQRQGGMGLPHRDRNGSVGGSYPYDGHAGYAGYSSAAGPSSHAEAYDGTSDLQSSMNAMSLAGGASAGSGGGAAATANGYPTTLQHAAAINRANTAVAATYAQQEIISSAAEVEPQNSLEAISDQVDDTAQALRAGEVPTEKLGLKGVRGDADPLHAPPAAAIASVMSGNGLPPGTSPSTAAAAALVAGSGNGGFSGTWQYDGNYSQQQQAYGIGVDPGLMLSATDEQGYYSHERGYAPSAAGGSSAGYNHAPYPAGYGAAAVVAAGGADPAQAAYYAGYTTQMYDQNANNAYFTAAQSYMGYPDGSMRSTAAGAAGYVGYPGAPGPGISGLVRQETTLSGSSAAQRKKRQDSANAQQLQQTLPFNKAFVAEYRHRMKADPDSEAQFAFAKYLIEAAKKINDPRDSAKQARKYRDALLSESLKLVKRLATTGMDLGKPPYAEAQFFLANCFGNGSLGLQVDHEKAYNLYVQASKQNHPAATYRTAVCNEVGAGTKRDHHRAVLFYRKASALGDTAGMYKLGMIMLNGLLGQQKNPREAIIWLKRAAGQADEENPHALHELGLLHERANNGVVVADEGYARELFTQAAQLGYAPSQFKLGSAYEYGALTCPVDPRRSIAWYTKAAGKNDGESELALSGWYLTGSEGVLKQSDSEAYLWARRAAQKGIPKAEYAVGYYSEVGIGVEANVEEAKRWYMRAAAQGNKRAMQRLTELKKQGARTGKKGARPTRKDAESECVVM